MSRFGGENSDGPPVGDECSNGLTVIPRAENQGFMRDHPPHAWVVNPLDERCESVSGLPGVEERIALGIDDALSGAGQ